MDAENVFVIKNILFHSDKDSNKGMKMHKYFHTVMITIEKNSTRTILYQWDTENKPANQFSKSKTFNIKSFTLLTSEMILGKIFSWKTPFSKLLYLLYERWSSMKIPLTQLFLLEYVIAKIYVKEIINIERLRIVKKIVMTYDNFLKPTVPTVNHQFF